MTKALVNNIERSPLANALVLHDFGLEEVHFKEAFYAVLDFFKEYELTPTRIDLTGSNGVKGNKLITAKNGIRKLETCDFKGIDGFMARIKVVLDLHQPLPALK